jgi:DNA mismatch endonuclease (patch repair protein)
VKLLVRLREWQLDGYGHQPSSGALASILQTGLDKRMADIVSPKERSALMARVRHKNTRPEMIVRRLLHSLGYRFRLHGELPGKPDIVFARRRKVLFVHGCFWHRHDDPTCRGARFPKSNQEYWAPKFLRNLERDKENRQQLEEAGWQAFVVWECRLRDPTLADELQEFLGPARLD